VKRTTQAVGYEFMDTEALTTISYGISRKEFNLEASQAENVRNLISVAI
jgi:hypothetical protein